jgi:hypothetical protein
MSDHPALVGIVPRKNLWDIIQKKRWYHIPVESAPKNAEIAEYLGFYFPSVFGGEMERNNELTSFGWRVLRFSGNEIGNTINN